jgi:transposase-like protein
MISDNNNLPKTLQQAIRFFSDDLTCVKFVASRRWSDGKAICPKCESINNTFMESRRVWQCKNKECKKQFSVKVGTIFEDSPITLDKWLMAMWLIVNAKNGISSYELHRAIGVTQKTAWFMNHRIRAAMEANSFEKLSGEIECDETYVGGDAKNMHAKKRKERVRKAGSQSHKTAVLGMIQRRGKVRAQVVISRDAKTIRDFVTGNAEAGSEVFTDEWRGYHNLYDTYVHQVINHSVAYVRENIHTNSIENFWSLLKRTIKGTYVSVEPFHLEKYVTEQTFRFNEREGNDKERFLELLKGIADKRLTYAELIGVGGWSTE